MRLRHILRERDLRGYTEEQVLSVYRDLGVVPKVGRTDNFNKTPEDLSNYKLVLRGDVVVNKMKAWQGSVAVSDHRGIVSGDYLVCSVSEAVDRRYLHHVLRSRPMVAEYLVRSKGIRPSQWRLYWDDLGDISVSLPQENHQRVIADFLDTETARMDALISSKRRMIDLLDERMTALCDASTYGLGVPLVPLRLVLRRLVDGTHGTYVRALEGRPLLSTKNLKRGFVLVTDDESLISESDYLSIVRSRGFQPGDVLLGVIGGSIGNVARLRPGDPLAFQRSVAALSPNGGYGNNFLYFVCRSRRFQEELGLASNSSAQAGVYLGELGAILVPMPSTSMQHTVGTRLGNAQARTDRMLAALSRSVRLLQEHRQALVTAAVTGQMEVPEVAA